MTTRIQQRAARTRRSPVQSRQRTIFEVHEVADMAELRRWAAAHGARVRYLGSTLNHQELYGAQRGNQLRVCRTEWESLRLHPISWASPLEHLPAT
jgi:hypothetical protein